MELRHSKVAGRLLYLLALVCLVTGDAVENTTDTQEASVQEVPNPTMTIERGDLSDYRLPGYYTFNNGEPFYLEKDPVTGAVDFTKKSPVGFASTTDFTSASKQDRVSGHEKAETSDSEYYEDDEISSSDLDLKEDGIDRKDGSIEGDKAYRPNDIEKNPFKISPDLHQFLNLPVHYSSSDKFPLISSSYANTKIQGTGGSNTYSNHKYATTSSTQSPSYYTLMRHSTSTTTTSTTTPSPPPSLPPPSILTTPKPKTTTKPPMLPAKTAPSTTTTTTTTTTVKSPYSEYNEGEELVYSDYDMEYGQPHNSHSGNHPSSAVVTTTIKTKPLVTLFKPTVISTTDDYITRKPVQNLTEEEEEEEVYEEDNVSIVTSLPVEAYYAQHPQTTTTQKTALPSSSQTSAVKPVITTTTAAASSTPTITTTTEQRKEPSTTVSVSKIPSKPTSASSTFGSTKYSTMYTEMFKPTPANNYHHYYGPKDNFEPIIDEPFRPIFGPHETSSQSSFSHKPQPVYNEVKPTPISQAKPYFEYHSPSNAKPLPNQGKIEFVERHPTKEQTSQYPNKPVNPPKYPGMEPPRPNPPLVFSNQGEHVSEHMNKPPHLPSVPNIPLFNVNEKPNPNSNTVRLPPQHESATYGRPQGGNNQQNNPVSGNGELPNRNQTPNQRPPFVRLPDDIPFHIKKHSNGTVVKLTRPEEIIYPQQRPIGVIPPSGLKPEARPTNQVVKFHPPMKHDNHYFKVPIDEENPSYSLQTSFAIGMPSADHPGDNEKDKNRPTQGVGQVLFPDGSPDTSLSSDNEKPVQPPPVRNRPTNTRPYITSYNQNNHPSQSRPPPPPQLLPQRPPQRLPGPELRPPKPGGIIYPRPHWENHSKPHILFNQNNPKQEMPPSYPSINRVKPDPNIQRPDLPNILPQFRPNAKVGTSEFPVNIGPERLREPMDTLQPPPLPQPQQLRANRNDDSGDDELEKSFEEIEGTQLPMVHRRTGSQPANRVTTLQMMQQSPPRRNLVRTDYNDHRQDRPVFLVYPTNGGSKPQTTSSEGVVVVGTRGSQQPLPPSNLDTPTTDIEDDIDPFPLDDNKHFSLPARDRVDTPVLKTKTSIKPALKNDFPYEILKPKENILPEERILAGNVATKEYNAFSPTVSSSTEDIKDHDAEINLIPYLQDYMPFATKKPVTQKPPVIAPQLLLNSDKSPDFIKMPSTVKPISVTLNTKLGTTVKPETSTEFTKHTKPFLPTITPQENMAFGSHNGGNSEYTVGAVMHTHQLKKPVNHRPFEVAPSSNQPKPIDLEAPFQASLSAPQSQGWTVVKANSEKQDQQVDRHEPEPEDSEKKSEGAESKFDFDNFKPQLFGGFQPIIPSSSEEKFDNSNKESTEEKPKERQEKKF